MPLKTPNQLSLSPLILRNIGSPVQNKRLPHVGSYGWHLGGWRYRFFARGVSQSRLIGGEGGTAFFAMDGLVASVATDAATIYSSVTDAEGFTVVSRHGGKSSSPPKQRLQSHPPPCLCDEVVRVNPFDKQFLNSFCVPGGPALDLDITVDFVTKQINDEQHFSPMSSSHPPPPLVQVATLPRTSATPRPASPPKSFTRAQMPPVLLLWHSPHLWVPPPCKLAFSPSR